MSRLLSGWQPRLVFNTKTLLNFRRDFDASLDELLQKVWDGQRIDQTEALRLYELNGCTSGTAGPRGWAKHTLERGSRVPNNKSASGSTTLKFLFM